MLWCGTTTGIFTTRKKRNNSTTTTMTEKSDKSRSSSTSENPEEEKSECYGPDSVLANATDQVLEQGPGCDDIYEVQLTFDRVFGATSDCIGGGSTGQSTNEKREVMIAEWKKATRPKHRVVRRFGVPKKLVEKQGGNKGPLSVGTVVLTEAETPQEANSPKSSKSAAAATTKTSSTTTTTPTTNSPTDSLLRKSRAPFPEDTRESSRALRRTSSKKSLTNKKGSSTKKPLYVIPESSSSKGKNKKDKHQRQQQDVKEVDSAFGSIASELSSEIDYELGADLESKIGQGKKVGGDFNSNFIYYPRNLSQHAYFRDMVTTDAK